MCVFVCVCMFCAASVCLSVILSASMNACMSACMYVKVSGMNIYIWTFVFGPVHEILVICTSAYIQKSALLKFVRGYGMGLGAGVLVCMWGAWFEVVWGSLGCFHRPV